MYLFRKNRTQSGPITQRVVLGSKMVHPCGVEWTIKTVNPYKVPGPDGIFPVLLKERLNVLLVP